MTTSSTSIQAPHARPIRRPAVPWATVLPLAVVLAYADGFWVTSLRGAVGAVGRGQGPFTTWWRESSVVIPVYVCAVIGALALALRRSRREGRRGSKLLVAGLLVVVAGTLVGVAEMTAGAAYDFHVQSEQVQMMASMRGDCRVDCIERLRQDTLWLQVRAVGLGAMLLLVTNLGLVAWVTSFRGGRLDVTRPVRARRSRRGPAEPGDGLAEPGDGLAVSRRLRVWATPVDGHGELQRLLAAALVGGAVIHLAVVPAHLDEWVAAGLFFIALAVVQAVGAVAALLRPGRSVLLLVIATSGGPLVVWVWSRIWGLPIGPEPGLPEPIGLPDCAAGALELMALVLAVVLLRGAPALATRSRMPDHLGRLALTGVLAVLVIGVAATQEGWFDVVQSASSAGMTSR